MKKYKIFEKDKINILRLDKSIAKNHTECLKIINEFYTGNKTSINEGKIGKNTNRYRISFFLFKREGAYIYSGFFDTLWHIPDFEISEKKIIQIIISIISKTKDKFNYSNKKKKTTRYCWL